MLERYVRLLEENVNTMERTIKEHVTISGRIRVTRCRSAIEGSVSAMLELQRIQRRWFLGFILATASEYLREPLEEFHRVRIIADRFLNDLGALR